MGSTIFQAFPPPPVIATTATAQERDEWQRAYSCWMTQFDKTEEPSEDAKRWAAMYRGHKWVRPAYRKVLTAKEVEALKQGIADMK